LDSSFCIPTDENGEKTMKKILAAGVAALIAIGAAGVTTTAVSAKDWNGPNDWKGQKWKGNNNWDGHHRRHGGGNWGWGLGGFALGYGRGALSGPYYGGYDRPYYGGGYYSGDAHVQWCLDRYRSYNPRTNTFFVRPGVERVCVSPYG